MSRSQLRRTSDGRIGDPSEKVRPDRRWNVTCRPPSSNRHNSARAGRTCRSRSNVVSDSNSWAVMAALPASPWTAGSRLVGAPVRMRTGRSEPAAGWDPHAAKSVASRTRASRRRIAGSIGRVGRMAPEPAPGMERGLASPHRRGNDGTGPRGLWTDNDARAHSLWPAPERLRRRRGDASVGLATSPSPPGRRLMLRLRNTLTRHVDPVEPLEPGRVRMYTCGPTVYRYAHVGNLRSNLLADLIRRTLLYHGLDVFHVKNITDVGHLRDEGFDRGADPMLVQAGLESKTPAEIAAAYEAAFHADEALVNILPAHVFPRATEHIEEMLRLAEALQDAGYAYATPERQRLLRRWRRSTATGDCRATPWPTCGPAIAATSSPTSATRPTSRSGRRPGRAGSSSGRHRAGAKASRAGISNALHGRGAVREVDRDGIVLARRGERRRLARLAARAPADAAARASGGRGARARHCRARRGAARAGSGRSRRRARRSAPAASVASRRETVLALIPVRRAISFVPSSARRRARRARRTPARRRRHDEPLVDRCGP